MNIISVDKERFDLDGDEGADIPDIPLRRRPNQGRSSPADLGLKTAMTLDNIIAGTRDLSMDPATGSPISHSGPRHGENQHRGGYVLTRRLSFERLCAFFPLLAQAIPALRAFFFFFFVIGDQQH